MLIVGWVGHLNQSLIQNNRVFIQEFARNKAWYKHLHIFYKCWKLSFSAEETAGQNCLLSTFVGEKSENKFRLCLATFISSTRSSLRYSAQNRSGNRFFLQIFTTHVNSFLNPRNVRNPYNKQIYTTIKQMTELTYALYRKRAYVMNINSG